MAENYYAADHALVVAGPARPRLSPLRAGAGETSTPRAGEPGTMIPPRAAAVEPGRNLVLGVGRLRATMGAPTAGGMRPGGGGCLTGYEILRGRSPHAREAPRRRTDSGSRAVLPGRRDRHVDVGECAVSAAAVAAPRHR